MANVHDSRLAEALIQGDEQGYHPLGAWQRLFNSWSSSIRCDIERAHAATMKRWYGMSRVRYRVLARNACHLRFVVTGMNMKHALVLMEPRMKHVGSEKHAGSKARQVRRKAGPNRNQGSKRSGRHDDNSGRHPPVRPPIQQAL